LAVPFIVSSAPVNPAISDDTTAARATNCVVQALGDLVPPVVRLYDTAAIPVLRPGAGEEGGGSGSGFASRAVGPPADTGGYELALSGSKSLAVTAGEGGAVGVDAALFVNVK